MPTEEEKTAAVTEDPTPDKANEQDQEQLDENFDKERALARSWKHPSVNPRLLRMLNNINKRPPDFRQETLGRRGGRERARTSEPHGCEPCALTN